MNVYLLLDDDYQPLAVFDDFDEALAARDEHENQYVSVEQFEVIGLAQWRDEEARQRADEERCAEAERLRRLKRLMVPHSYPRPYRAPHVPTPEQLDSMRARAVEDL